MKVSVNYDEVIKITPNIEGDDVYSITVNFANSECMCYGYTDKTQFSHDYKYLMRNWTRYCDM